MARRQAAATKQGHAEGLCDGAVARTITIRVPLSLRRRGGRKLIVMPGGATGVVTFLPEHVPPNGTLVKALACAFRWRALLEDGTYSSISELAAAEKINESYVARVIRLTLLAPDVVEAILNGGRQELTVVRLQKPFPAEWQAQRSNLMHP